MGDFRKKEGYFIDKKGNFRRGSNIALSVPKTKSQINPADNDRDNRRKILKKLDKLVEEGKTIEAAVEILYNQEDIRLQFSYLEKNGLDLKNIFEQWYNSYITNKNNKFNRFISERDK